MRLFILFIGLTLSAVVWAGPRYALGVDGLACPFCAYGLEKRLLRENTVERVETDIAKSHLIVELQDGAAFTEPQAQQAVEDAGFTLRSFETLADPQP